MNLYLYSTLSSMTMHPWFADLRVRSFAGTGESSFRFVFFSALPSSTSASERELLVLARARACASHDAYERPRVHLHGTAAASYRRRCAVARTRRSSRHCRHRRTRTRRRCTGTRRDEPKRRGTTPAVDFVLERAPHRRRTRSLWPDSSASSTAPASEAAASEASAAAAAMREGPGRRRDRHVVCGRVAGRR